MKKTSDNRVVKILMERDLIDECREECIECQSDKPIQDILGLKSDYLFDILL